MFCIITLEKNYVKKRKLVGEMRCIMSKRNRRSLPEDDPPQGAAEWLTTYSDMVTLLLTFFVLLFSMASVDSKKFEEVAYSLRSAFMHISSGEIFYNIDGTDVVSIFDSNMPEAHDVSL